MSLLRSFADGLRRLFRKDQVEQEMDEELHGYLDSGVEERMRNGMSYEEALRAAKIEMGSMEMVKEEIRSVCWEASVESLWQDLRYGVRILRKDPGFTLVAVLTLALGIGVNTTIFSFVSAVLLRKPPLPDPDRVMMLRSKNPAAVWAADLAPVSGPDFLDWQAQSTSYTGMAAASFDEFTLSGGTEPERVAGGRVSPGYFSVLGVAPMLGRAFAPEEDQPGHEHVVMLSESLWRQRFGADPRVIGSVVKVNGTAATVVGIMPDRFQFWSFPAQIWMPLGLAREQSSPKARGARTLDVFARLKPGVTEAQALAELSTIAGRLAASHPDTNKGWGANVKSLQEYVIEFAYIRPALVFLMATVGLVLLIACANLANLLLARNSARQQEFTIRAALGAGRARLARQLLLECLLLSLGGGGLGLLFASFGAQVIRSRMNWSEYAVRIGQTIFIDWRVLAFTLAVSVVSALVFGLAPALRLSRPDLNAGLKEGGRTTTPGRDSHRLQNLLVVSELALSLILVAAAGLFAKAFIEEMQTTLGMNPQNVLTATISLSGPSYQEGSNQVAFSQQVLHQLRASPQVEAAAVTTDLPLTFPNEVRFTQEGQPSPTPDHQPMAGYYAVSPGYFDVIQTPLLAGRQFTADDAAGASVVMVDAAFAHKYFANANAVGQHIRLAFDDAARAPWSEIVGVVGEAKEYRGQDNPRAHIFAPFLSRPVPTMRLVVRTRTDPSAFAGSLRRAVWSVDKDQAVTDVRTMSRVVADSVQGDDLMSGMMGAFAAIALAMAAIGIYGLLANWVGRRTHEIGVRMALGARRGEVLSLVMRGAMSLVLAGVGVGFLVSLGLPRLFGATFNGYHVHSGWILAGTPLAVLLVALASCYVPARRATRVDPMTALRYE